MRAGDEFPVAEVYRGVNVHGWQSESRMAVVRSDIDAVHNIADPVALADWAADQLHSPESRLFAASKCEATFELCTEQREVRPKVDLLKLRASTVGLDVLYDADRDYYCSIFDVRAPDAPRPARRETPLPERQRGR